MNLECPNCPGRDDHDAEHCPIKPKLREPTMQMIQAACAAFRMDISPMDAMRNALRAALLTLTRKHEMNVTYDKAIELNNAVKHAADFLRQKMEDAAAHGLIIEANVVEMETISRGTFPVVEIKLLVRPDDLIIDPHYFAPAGVRK